MNEQNPVSNEFIFQGINYLHKEVGIICVIFRITMDLFFNKIHDYILNHNLVTAGDSILMSISAGKDSMALFHVLLALAADLKLDLGAFHLNHMMRGAESDSDELFLTELCDRHSIRLFLERHDFKKNKLKKMSFEEQARNHRYSSLEKIRNEGHYDKITMAHSRSDNVETILMRIFTGTGLYGLRGVRPERNHIIRPLLCVSSREIYGYLNDNSIPWREDSSNSLEEHRRNYIRNKIIPGIEYRFPMIEESIISIADYANENEKLLESLTCEFMEKTVEKRVDGIYLRCGDLKGNLRLMRFLIQKILRDEFCISIEKHAYEQIFKNIFPVKKRKSLYKKTGIEIEVQLINGIEFLKINNHPTMKKMNSGWEYIIDLGSSDPCEVYMKEPGITITVMSVDYEYFKIHKNENSAVFIELEAKTSISIRNWKPGDRMETEAGTKKIKKIMNEKKLDMDFKNDVPLLVFNNKIAAFMPGIINGRSNRVGRDFIVTGGGKKIIAIFRKFD
ncbi:MAG: tRNA lysidine(34) synthetase TilS [Spirochaetes bacterium]|jgi:tRNA(Ile)-lysidine synthase|nr:tRNA lysidine(34) synthetase TilS [Spirochaetota bacterium]